MKSHYMLENEVLTLTYKLEREQQLSKELRQQIAAANYEIVELRAELVHLGRAEDDHL